MIIPTLLGIFVHFLLCIRPSSLPLWELLAQILPEYSCVLNKHLWADEALLLFRLHSKHTVNFKKKS